MMLMSYPPQRRCSQCDFTGVETEWMSKELERERERVQSAYTADMFGPLRDGEVDAIAELIDAKIELALLERNS
jgi:hypothetical protein